MLQKASTLLGAKLRCEPLGGEFFGNYFASANIGNCLDCGSDYQFGQVFGTRNDPRNIQLSLKITF